MKNNIIASIKKASSFVGRHKKIIALLLLFIVFFSFSVILTYDSAHYLGYVSIIEGNAPASSWDIVRGPVFPILIRLSDVLFGKTSTGILILTFLFYLSFALICSILCKEIAKHYKRPKLFYTITTAILILNPLIFGYFHVLLTEFVAITITMLNILLALKWIGIDYKNKKAAWLYSLYFILVTILCWHLKQPYILIAILPLTLGILLSILNNHKKSNVLYRVATLFASLLFLFLSIITWNAVLDRMHVNKNTGRDSSSILSKQLLITYQIPFEQKQAITAADTISTMANNFFANPGQIIGIYFRNYCSLSSLCKVSTPNGSDYVSTGEIDLLETYENTAIGYATYRMENNIYYMKEDMRNRAQSYSTPVSRSIFSYFMKLMQYPTNIAYKLLILLCFPLFIILIIVRIRTKKKGYDSLFNVSFLLLGTSSLYIVFSAFALVIDRYGIEAFAPSILGTMSTITYIKAVCSKNKTKTKTKAKKKK